MLRPPPGSGDEAKGSHSIPGSQACSPCILPGQLGRKAPGWGPRSRDNCSHRPAPRQQGPRPLGQPHWPSSGHPAIAAAWMPICVTSLSRALGAQRVREARVGSGAWHLPARGCRGHLSAQKVPLLPDSPDPRLCSPPSTGGRDPVLPPPLLGSPDPSLCPLSLPPFYTQSRPRALGLAAQSRV